MASMETTRPVAGPASGRLSQMIIAVIAAFAAWNDARVTRHALSRLSARELDDIGLCPGDIALIAARGGKR